MTSFVNYQEVEDCARKNGREPKLRLLTASMDVYDFFNRKLIALIAECREYEDAKYEKEWLPAIGFNEKPVLKKILHCATSNVPLIVGGEVANAGEFPHMVTLCTSRNIYIRHSYSQIHIFL